MTTKRPDDDRPPTAAAPVTERTAADKPDAPAPTPESAARAGCRSLIDGATTHPLVAVAVLGTCFAVYQCVWVSRVRLFGAMDTDEGGGVFTTLAFHRALEYSPGAFYAALFGTASGPMVPALAVPFVAVFGRSVTTPLFIQPVMIAISAVAAAGCVLHLAGRRAALLAGVIVLGMPALVTSSRTHQFSNGVGMFMVLALWALLTSDHGRRSWHMLAFGAACGAMIMSRTMAVGFLPAMAAAAVIVVDLRRRRSYANLTLALAGAGAVAGKWWYTQWDYLYSYLTGYGYGSRAGIYGSVGLMDRVGSHVAYLLRDFRLFLPLGALVAGISLTLALVRLAATRDRIGWLRRHTDLLAVDAAVILGTATLLSSANRGFWFATPLDILIVVAVVSAGSRAFATTGGAPRWTVPGALIVALALLGWSTNAATIGASLGITLLAVTTSALLLASHRRRAGITATIAVGIAVAVTVAGAPATGPTDQFGDSSSARAQVIGGLERYQHTIYDADARLLSSDRGIREAAAREWADATIEVDRRLLDLQRRFDADTTPAFGEVVTGSRPLFDTNALGVARELGTQGVRRMVTTNTFGPSDDQMMVDLTPRFDDGLPRVLIVIEGRSLPFPDSLGWQHFVRLAERRGWQARSTVALPDRGQVVIYTHPDSDPTL